MERAMHALEHKIPPPVVLAFTWAVMWAAAGAFPVVPIGSTLRLAVAGAFIVLGLCVAMVGFAELRRAKTTTDPLHPGAASSIVTRGVYRYTRNPMYLGSLIALVGWAVYLAVPWLLLGPVFYALFLTRFQVIPEERALRAKFGTEYAEYVARVRRWL
jgi:protein-S-isoprenylcysteine O-methyltransferase Ste14